MRRPLEVAVRGVGVVLEGMPHWNEARAVLAGQTIWQPAPVVLPAAELLPAAERRRAGGVIRLALGCAQQAVAGSGMPADRLASVFATADADGENTHLICEALTQPQPMLSPTRFHNSVQNAVSGYWSIATGSRAATTTLLADDDVLAHALLEAAAQVASEQTGILMIVYDLPMPAPLAALHPIRAGGAVAFVLDSTERAPADAQRMSLTLSMVEGARRITPMMDAGLEAVRAMHAPGRALPLLQLLSTPRDRARACTLGYGQGLVLEVKLR